MRRPVGVKSILTGFIEQVFFSRRVATVAMLPSALSRAIVTLGACWAFSVQPVLPSVWRPVVLLLKSGTWARPLTQSPELGFGFCRFSSWNGLVFTRLRLRSSGGCCAAARTLLRSATGDAATPPAFAQSPRWLASCCSSRHVRLVSDPSA